MIKRRGIILAQDELDEIWEKRIIDANINVLGLGPDTAFTPTVGQPCWFVRYIPDTERKQLS